MSKHIYALPIVIVKGELRFLSHKYSIRNAITCQDFAQNLKEAYTRLQSASEYFNPFEELSIRLKQRLYLRLSNAINEGLIDHYSIMGNILDGLLF